MAEKTPVEMALNSISWQLKRIADSLEEIEDILNPAPNPDKSIDVNDWLTGGKSADTNRPVLNPNITSSKLKAMLASIKGETSND